MLVNYLLQINLRDAAREAPEDRSIGFHSRRYHFSTAAREGYFQCLDGGSFSAVAQQNAIARGGELSTMRSVEISIASRAVSRHIEDGGLNLLGARCSMAYVLGAGGAERAVFRQMLVGEFSRKSDVLFILRLEDSAFADAAPAMLARPGRGGESGDLSTRIGEEAWLPVSKLAEGMNLYNQGMAETPLFIPELEGVGMAGGLPSRNGKPCFPSSFNASYIAREGNDGEPSILWCADSDIPVPALLGLEGLIVEVYSGKGAGNKYKILRTARKADATLLYLDRPLEGEILPNHPSSGAGAKARLRALPSIANYFFTHPKVQAQSEDSDISFFRVAYANPRYYVGLWEGMDLGKSVSARIAMPDGSMLENACQLDILEEDGNYRIIACASAAADKIKLKSSLRQNARFCRKELAMDGSLQKYSTDVFSAIATDNRIPDLDYSTRVSDGEQAPSSGGMLAIFEDIRATPPENILDEFLLNNPFPDNFHHWAKAQISMYWRLDELNSLELDSISPGFSITCKTRGSDGAPSAGAFRLSAKALLLDDNLVALEAKDFRANTYSKPTPFDESLLDGESVMPELKSTLTFSGGLLKFAKYLYLQIGVDLRLAEDDIGNIYISRAILDYEYSVSLDKAEVKARRKDREIRSPAQLAQAICLDNGIAIDEASFGEAHAELARDILGDATDFPSMEISNGDAWDGKLSELCRAANFSLHSDGGQLCARYFPADRGKEPAWVIREKDIIANSYDISAPESGYISTDYEFSMPSEAGAKTLNVSAGEDEFPGIDAWEYADDWTLEGDSVAAFPSSPAFKGAMMLRAGLPTAGKYAGKQFVGLMPGCLYEIKYAGKNPSIMRLLDMRRLETQIDCIFEGVTHSWNYFSGMPATIRPVKSQEQWKIMTGGGYPIDYASAAWLYGRAKAALDAAKKRIKMDERYTKHSAMAYASPDLQLKSILNTVAHNTYAKTLVKFSVPLSSLPAADLPSLMLARLRLEFGWFKKSPIDGWLIGYSLNPSSDAAEMTFLSSEAFAPERKIYDENETADQIILDESPETPGKLIMEGA
jgi:hypothetical protein